MQPALLPCCLHLPDRAARPGPLPRPPALGLSWEDGELVERDLEATDRWTIHAAHEVRITIADVPIRIKQDVRPRGLGKRGMLPGGKGGWDCMHAGRNTPLLLLGALGYGRHFGAA